MIRVAANRTARAAGAAPAAPAGGARRHRRGRGCGQVLGAALFATTATAAEPVTVEVPSGQPLTLAEILTDRNPGELWLRFRFVAPGISRDGGAVAADAAASDMDWLCENLALPYLGQHDLAPARIVISFSDRAVPFGQPAPDATQFFEAYRLENGRCIWEEF